MPPKRLCDYAKPLDKATYTAKRCAAVGELFAELQNLDPSKFPPVRIVGGGAV